MKTFYMLYSPVNDGKLMRFDDRVEARRVASGMARGNSAGVFVLKAVELVREPVPNAEVIALED